MPHAAQPHLIVNPRPYNYMHITLFLLKNQASVMPRVGQRHNLKVFKQIAVDGQADYRSVPVPSLQTGRPRIYMEQIERLVVLHFQYMRVSGDEKLRRIGVNRRASARPRPRISISTFQETCAASRLRRSYRIRPGTSGTRPDAPQPPSNRCLRRARSRRTARSNAGTCHPSRHGCR